MKAILVIDCDKEELGEAVATITANDITFFTKGVIKPLPTKKQEEKRWYSEDYSIGWNACLDAIVGDYITQEEADLCGVQFWHDD